MAPVAGPIQPVAGLVRSVAGRPHIAALDGLRGLAVVAVLLFHAGYLRGGFLGVDLFFVLSGFLITGLLLDELGRRGRLGLAAFWGRRARRLLPALVVVTVSAPPLAWACARPDLLAPALRDAPWVAVQGVNWHYIAERIGYWNASGTRLFAHLWSIGVEWQFYLVWPLVVALAGRGPGGPRRVALVALAGAVVSFVVMLRLGAAVDTTRAYEGTDTRAFSLLLGAAAATAPVRNAAAALPRAAVEVLGGVLLCGLAVSWVLTDGERAPGLFQGGLFAHSLASAALIVLLAGRPGDLVGGSGDLAGGSGDLAGRPGGPAGVPGGLAGAPGGLVGRMVGSAVPRRLGELSYGLYLWHWPIFLLMLPREPAADAGRAAAAIGLSLLAAVVSKAAVEDPVRRRAPWSTGRRGWAALAVAGVLAAGLWAAIPWPQPGAGTVDVSRLGDA